MGQDSSKAGGNVTQSQDQANVQAADPDALIAKGGSFVDAGAGDVLGAATGAIQGASNIGVQYGAGGAAGGDLDVENQGNTGPQSA